MNVGRNWETGYDYRWSNVGGLPSTALRQLLDCAQAAARLRSGSCSTTLRQLLDCAQSAARLRSGSCSTALYGINRARRNAAPTSRFPVQNSPPRPPLLQRGGAMRMRGGAWAWYSEGRLPSGDHCMIQSICCSLKFLILKPGIVFQRNKHPASGSSNRKQ